MVLESLFTAKRLIDKPRDTLLLSILISVASIFISYFIFPTYAGIIAPLLITVAMAPVMYNIFSIEEKLAKKQARKLVNKSFIDRYDEIIKIFGLFFIGNIIAVFALTVILPADISSAMFSQQLSEIEAIRSISTGNAVATGNAIFPGILGIIIVNNLKVVAFSFFLAFLIETGGIFILSWNASILAIYLASFINQGLFGKFFAVTVGIFPHAIIEILAYFLAGIGGGILSLGLVRDKIGSPTFNLILRDAIILGAAAILLIIVGGYVEVYT